VNFISVSQLSKRRHNFVPTLKFKVHKLVKMVIGRFYQKPGLGSAATATKLSRQHIPLVNDLETELCFSVETTSTLSGSELEKIWWILGSPLESQNLTTKPNLHGVYHGSLFTETGSRCV
jgi:hypothetical protein